MGNNFTSKVYFFFLFALATSLSFQSSGQFSASQYGFTAVAGTYTDLTGGTGFPAVQTDDLCPAATIPIGFSFNYCGTNYTALRAASNGYLTFSSGTANTAGNSVANLNTIKPALMWLWDDLDGANGNASYATTGVAPNRVFTFQFKNWDWYWNAIGPNISCQVKLYETTNVIEYIYKQEAQPGTPNSATIGICDGAATPTYLSLNNATAAATASSATFTTNIAAKPPTGQIYRFTPPSCTTVTNWPASATTTVSPGTACISGNINLSFNPVTPVQGAAGISYQWQSASSAMGPWTNIGVTSGPTFTTTVSGTFYRCQLMCNTTVMVTSSASSQLIVNNPGTPTVTGSSRCGPGTLTLNATPPAGSTILWYANATGGVPLATTNNYTTPYIPATTTYYAAATSGTTPVTAQIGSAVTSTDGSTAGPFNIWFRRSTMQFLYTGSEITAAGGGGGIINSLAFNCTALPTYNILNYTVKVKTVPSTMTNLTWQATGMTTVYNSANYMPAAVGWQILNFTAPIPYSAGEGIVVELCWDQTQPTFSGTGGSHQFTNISGRFLYSWTDGAGTSCGLTGTTASSNLPNVRFGMDVICEGTRQPVTATITPGPAINIAKPAIVCSGEIGNIIATSAPMTNYTTYAWTPNAADLYTNPAATTAYVAGSSASNVYFKSTTNGLHTYYLFASGATPAACTHADTISIWVQPDSVKITASVDSICITGTSTLTLSPSTGYAANSIQWQESTNGLTYNNIAGATGVTYTTPTLTANHFYRALIKSTNDTCEMPVKEVVVVIPQLLSVSDSFHCDPGVVTLHVQTGSNSTAYWYAAATGGTPIGSGSPWTTPSLNASQTYYVSAGSLTCQTSPRQAVQAYIRPKPVVDLGPDGSKCVDVGNGIVLDAGFQPNMPSFLWDNNSTSQVRAVTASGTYYVKVTNQYTCIGTDTVYLTIANNPVINLNDTTVCNGVTLTLDAGTGGIEYFWNTGQVGQTIDVNSSGSYNVFVTNAGGCTAADTAQVTMDGELPTINGIQISNNGNMLFQFFAVYPQNVVGYDWDFGDGSPHSNQASPMHEYDSVGDYIVVLRLSSSCGFITDTVGAHIVGIRQLNVNKDELTVYPNPSNGQATILNKGDLKMEKVEIYNILGQVVYRSKADSKDKHIINLSNIASGVYTIEIYTDKGTVARKLEVIK